MNKLIIVILVCTANMCFATPDRDAKLAYMDAKDKYLKHQTVQNYAKMIAKRDLMQAAVIKHRKDQKQHKDS